MKIQTHFVYPPILIRDFDWSAVDADTYDADCDDERGFFSNSPIGYGRTEQAAIDDLMAQIEEEDAEGA